MFSYLFQALVFFFKTLSFVNSDGCLITPQAVIPNRRILDIWYRLRKKFSGSYLSMGIDRNNCLL
jgi:hypothetical protein